MKEDTKELIRSLLELGKELFILILRILELILMIYGFMELMKFLF
mgnify:CR=1 FL=1